MSEPALPPRKNGRKPGGLSIGRLRSSLPVILVLALLLGSAGYILWVVREVHDEQIPLLAYGFAALALSFGAIALGCVVGMWRAASRAEGGRSFGLALVGGLSALATIGSLTVVALLLLVWNS